MNYGLKSHSVSDSTVEKYCSDKFSKLNTTQHRQGFMYHCVHHVNEYGVMLTLNTFVLQYIGQRKLK